MKRLEQFVALRYLRSKRQHSFIGVITIFTLIGITVGTAALNLGLAVHNGMRQAFLESLIGDTGLIYMDDGRWEAEGFTLEEVKSTIKTLEQVPSIQSVAYLRKDFGIITTPAKRSAPTQLFGVVPSLEPEVSPFLKELVAGSWEPILPKDPNRRPGIALGYDLSRRLGARVGDRIRLTFARASSPNPFVNQQKLKAKVFEVCAIFRTGSSDIDMYRAYLDIGVLMDQMGNQSVDMLQIKLKHADLLDDSKALIRNLDGLPGHARFFDLREANQNLLGALQLEKWGTTLIISLIIAVAALNLISALIMLIMEKKRDIGILRALGCGRKMIIQIFLRQGMTISVLGTILGTILGVSLAFLADHYQWLKLDREVYEVLKYLPFKIRWTEVGLVALGSMVTSFLASLYPAVHATSIDPVEALRYE